MKNKILSLFSNTIPYIKELRPITGTVTSAILMQQLDYWFARKPQGFYKYLEPPKGKASYYKEGDSWCEETGFSAEEFQNAFKKIGVAYKSKTDFKGALAEDKAFFTTAVEGEEAEEKFYARYHDRDKGMSFYYRNNKLVDDTLDNLVGLLETENVGLRETDDVGLPIETKTENVGLLETENVGLHGTENTLTENTLTENKESFAVAIAPHLELQNQIQIPLTDLSTLTSKESVMHSLVRLAESSYPAVELSKLVTTDDLKSVVTNCKKKHKTCTCPHEYELPQLKFLKEAIHIISSGSADFGTTEGVWANKIVCRIRQASYDLDSVLFCLAWAYQTKKFEKLPSSLSTVFTVIPEFLDKNRTGTLKESMLNLPKYENASQRAERINKNRNHDQITKNAAKRLTEKYGLS